LERITLELFAKDSLAPLELTPVTASGTPDLIFTQNVVLPMKLLRDSASLILCPGFPPSLTLSRFGGRVIPYIHDLFLITRTEDLNPRARLYMAPSFRHAVATLPLFFVNSQYTADSLRAYCRPDAEIMLYRPGVRNVFKLNDSNRLAARPEEEGEGPLRLIALGTIEPRKNLLAAADIVTALRANGHKDAQLDIVGRFGWGEDVERLQATPGVTLHGYQSVERIRDLMASADLFINTSHDEGLGLPLLEAQYAGLPVIAPDAPVFREVLGASGLLVETERPKEAADRIGRLVAEPGWRDRQAQMAAANLERWNSNVTSDRDRLIERLMEMAGIDQSKRAANQSA
jgi:glycosyltransferase involved in cell wall biosynthesis